MDPNLPISRVKTMDEVMAESMAEPRAMTLLLGLFGAAALMLAAMGIYGVISYTVSRRVREMGVRVALGAESRDIVKLVVGYGLKLSIAGVVAGLAVSFALTGLMKSRLFEVSATDPLTILAVAALLTFVALLACFIPARRETRVDPMVALRYE